MGGSDISFISRGTAGGVTAPYPLHTHVDVIFALYAHGLITSDLCVALAACHDAYEEGSLLRFRSGKWQMEQVDLEELINKFPKDGLGRGLAIGVPALTETPFDELTKILPGKVLQPFQTDSLAHFASKGRYPKLDRETREKVHTADPLVFGGLAVQVREVVGALLERRTSSDSMLLR